MAGNPLAGVLDAMGAAAASYSPDNALRVLELLDALPGLVDGMASMLSGMGHKTVEQFPVNAMSAEVLNSIGAQVQRFRPALEDVAHGFRSAHADEIQRILNPRPNEHKWDVSVNAE